jgi:small subunit ribosomal protein S9
MSPRKPKSKIEDEKELEKASESEDKASKKSKYIEAVGRRKTSVARVRLFPQKSDNEEGLSIIVNDKKLEEYFNYPEDQLVVKAPFKALSLKGYGVTVKVKGGGIKAQSEAVRLGVARALVKLNPLWRPPLKTLGFLKRDPRMVERKKYGRRKARRPQQWRKR